jgi:predicted HicB family RNase H-like nuclease
MQLQPHLEEVQDQLRAAAALGDDRTREIADALATAAAPAVRLAVLNALSGAADEITAALLDFPGSPVVTVRLDGDEVAVDVHVPHAAPEAEEPRRDDGDASARISLRLSETLKADIDAVAEQEGVSVNTWLVRAAQAALRPAPFGAFGQFGPGFPFNFGPTGRGGRGRGHRDDQHHITGWING